MKKIIFGTVVLLSITPLLILYFSLPKVKPLATSNPTTSAIRAFRENQIRDRKGAVRSLMIWKDLSAISPDLQHAVILSEDDRFYQHQGFDFDQMKKAAEENWKRKKLAFGASTLTQQLARSLYLSPRKSFFRKFREALITHRLEKTLPKKRILELYLNVVEWGPQVYGAEAASQHFFNKSTQDLTTDEAISLALILPSPWRWRPTSDTPFMNRRKVELYDRMVRAHFIDPLKGAIEEVPMSEDEIGPSRESGTPTFEERPLPGPDINPDVAPLPGDAAAPSP